MSEKKITSQETLQALAQNSDWLGIIEQTDNLAETQSRNATLWFFRGWSLLKVEKAREAVRHIEYGLTLSENSDWGNQLLFEALLACGDNDRAFNGYKHFIERKPGPEAGKAWYVQKAAELGYFKIASDMNETRVVIRSPSPRKRFALALQCFAKVDTLQAVIESFEYLKSSQDFNLVVIIDKPAENSSPQHVVGNREVRQLVGHKLDFLLRKFPSVEVLQNAENLGTAPTCRRLLDHVACSYDGFLFIEDDCVLSPSALDWSKYHLTKSVGMQKLWFFSCESVFFNKQGRVIDKKLKSDLKWIAKNAKLLDKYNLLDFVPSTCFGTTSDVWKSCAGIRSFTRGPESLTKYIQLRGLKTLSPVVPRASDIGMQHELGYSVNMVGRKEVREVKDTYVMADSFDPESCDVMDIDPNQLYAATSEIDRSVISMLQADLDKC